MNPLLTAVRRVFSQPAFLAAAMLLGVCAATLNTAAAFMKLHFKKQPCAMRVSSLRQGIPTTLGKWVMVSTDEAIDPEVEQVLGTSQYIFRDYVDSSRVSDEEIKQLKSVPARSRDAMIRDIQSRHPAAVLRAAITYYTGLVDTVAHVPERCYVADGFEVKSHDDYQMTLKHPGGETTAVPFRFVSFQDSSNLGAEVADVSRNVGYVFHCNGAYENDHLAVRARLQNLFEPYGYYAKLELMTAVVPSPAARQYAIDANDKDDSKEAMVDFMTQMLPEFEKCMPDWKALHAPH